jgi:hypothetical protein
VALNVTPSSSPDVWTFSEKAVLEEDLLLKLSVTLTQLRFLQTIKAVWRPPDPEISLACRLDCKCAHIDHHSLHVPLTRPQPKTDKLDLSQVENDLDISRVHSAIVIYFLRAHVIGLTPEEVLARHRSLDSLQPNFALVVYRTSNNDMSMEDALHIT